MPQPKKINLFDGRVVKASPMTQPQIDVSAVANGNIICIFEGLHNIEIFRS